MANKEMFDYFGGVTIVPDYSATTFALDIFPQGITLEESKKNVVVHLGDDGSEERISLSGSSPIFYVDISWEALTETEAGSIFDFYNDSSKADGMLNSFYWQHKGELTDTHTYVARFNSSLPRELKSGNLYGYSNVSLKILGASGW